MNFLIPRRHYITSLCLLAGFTVMYANAAEPDKDFAAIIKSPKTAVLSTQVDGLVTRIHVRDGESFKKDDVLVTLDCTQQHAKLEKAKAQFRYASQQHTSLGALAKLNSASQMQISQSKAERQKAKAELTAAEHHVSQCVVIAPFDGSVVQSWVNQHENVQAKSKALEIVNNQNLIAEFLAPSDMLVDLTVGLEFELSVNETRQSYPAIIDRIVPQIDSVSQTIKVIGKLTSTHPDLWSGMSGWAKLQ